MSLESFERYTEKVDEYARLRASGIIDPFLLDQANRFREKIKDSQALRLIAFRQMKAIQRIEKGLGKNNIEKTRRTFKYVQYLIGEAHKIYPQIIAYELGEGAAAPLAPAQTAREREARQEQKADVEQEAGQEHEAEAEQAVGQEQELEAAVEQAVKQEQEAEADDPASDSPSAALEANEHEAGIDMGCFSRELAAIYQGIIYKIHKVCRGVTLPIPKVFSEAVLLELTHIANDAWRKGKGKTELNVGRMEILVTGACLQQALDGVDGVLTDEQISELVGGKRGTVSQSIKLLLQGMLRKSKWELIGSAREGVRIRRKAEKVPPPPATPQDQLEQLSQEPALL